MKDYAFLLLALLFSCDQKPKPPANLTASKSKSAQITKQNDSSLKKWLQYYQSENPDFQLDNFKLKETSKISFRETSVAILNKQGFNETYKPFLVFNKSKDHYLDFDSYNWFLEADGTAGFEADQQVILVDLKQKKARQIAFFGPSFWVEEAYWKEDSVAVLLGNSYDKIPFKTEYNFLQNTVKYYQSADTLKFETPYFKMRLRKKGIKID